VERSITLMTPFELWQAAQANYNDAIDLAVPGTMERSQAISALATTLQAYEMHRLNESRAANGL
jgi:hypothetical protein